MQRQRVMPTPPSDPRARPDRVLVVLPVLNEERHVEDCIRSLMVPEEWMASTTMVVADGGSTDHTRKIVNGLRAEFPNLHLMDNPGRLQSAGINTAVLDCAKPDHDILIRCDAHATYPAGYVRDVATALRQRGADSVATVMDAVGEAPLQRAAAWIVDTPLGSGGAAHRNGRRSRYVDHGHHAAFDLYRFRELEGYNFGFSHNEDAEYDLRLCRAGGRIWLAADIRLAYVMRASFMALARQYWAYGGGRARTILKHRCRPRLRQILPAFNIVALPASLFTGLIWPPALAWIGLYLLFLAGASVCCAAALRSSDGLLAGLTLAVMHISWGAGFLRTIAAIARDSGGAQHGPGCV